MLIVKLTVLVIAMWGIGYIMGYIMGKAEK